LCDLQCLLDISIIGGLLYTTYKYGTNSAQLLAAGRLQSNDDHHLVAIVYT
jgi:hypothetical protein